ncbi:F-box/LRR-repeat protein 12 [Orchesella cincta]|uniref:F-box/LRR-repeat protein 12 n=1 Tax=Orchesella cincta TaxID=48709 RepID=A0A1D2MRU8_ORCCI|nr:F-box/LRR-repeat protein 12 [Orchesella cincta]
MAAKTIETDPCASHASDEKNGTRLQELPDKCLIAIFKFLPLDNLDNIIELSPHWDKLVQENIPVEVHLTDVGFRVALHFFNDHYDLPKYRIKVLHSRVFDEPLPELKSPEDLQKLEFITPTQLSTFNTFVSKAINLKELHFTLGSLSQYVISEMELNLPNLKLLSIVDRPIAYKDDPTILSRNISGFLEKTFPSIEKIIILTVANRKQTVEYTKDLLKFIQTNANSLRKVKFNVSTSIQKGLLGDKGLSDSVELSSPEDFDLQLLASAKLEELELSFGRDFIVGLEKWIWLLNNQTSLAHLNMGMDKLLRPTLFETPITRSTSTLVSIQLGIENFVSSTNERCIVECNVFENCTKLQMLVLTGSPYPENCELRPPTVELKNLEKLPKSMFGLAVENFYVETDDLKELIRGVRMKERTLKKLALRNIGVEGTFGVTLMMLDFWISAEVLTEILVKGINGNECQLHEYEMLTKFGVQLPLDKCTAHALYYPSLMEYRKPQQNE